jgi:hypothetical protein
MKKHYYRFGLTGRDEAVALLTDKEKALVEIDLEKYSKPGYEPFNFSPMEGATEENIHQQVHGYNAVQEAIIYHFSKPKRK